MQQEAATTFNNPFVRFIINRKYRWLRHGLFLLMGLILSFKGDLGSEVMLSASAKQTILLADCIAFIVIMGILYSFILFFVPRLLFRSHLVLFLITFIAAIISIFLVAWAIDFFILKQLNLPAGFNHIELAIVDFIEVGMVAAVLLASVVGATVFKKWITDVQRMHELQKNNLEAELQQLKSQVNPHFLFNTLNNLLVLTKTDTEKATQVLHGLSDLLRYQLYDSTKEKIVLSQDIRFIQNYLSLEQIRKSDFTFNIHTKGLPETLLLPPFLFIPFVENAVKHGAQAMGPGYLDLHFIKVENELRFTSVNSKPALKTIQPGGLGLENIRRRLELLFPGAHMLEINETIDTFTVHLNISL